MTKTVYAPNTDLLILKYIKVVSGTTKHFAPDDTKHISKFSINTQGFLAELFTTIYKQIHKGWLFCCFSLFAGLPQRIPKCNILKTFFIFNTTGNHFRIPNLLWFFLSGSTTDWKGMQGLFVSHKLAILLWVKGSSHHKLLQKFTDWHSPGSLILSTARKSLIVIILVPVLSVYIRCSGALWDVLFSIKTQQSWRVPCLLHW